MSFTIGWFDLLEVQGTLKSLLQHYDSKGSILAPLCSLEPFLLGEAGAKGTEAKSDGAPGLEGEPGKGGLTESQLSPGYPLS